MSQQHDTTATRAIENVAQRHSTDQWWGLPAGRRTQAIYDEMKRLDLEAKRQAVAAGKQVKMPAFEMA